MVSMMKRKVEMSVERASDLAKKYRRDLQCVLVGQILACPETLDEMDVGTFFEEDLMDLISDLKSGNTGALIAWLAKHDITWSKSMGRAVDAIKAKAIENAEKERAKQAAIQARYLLHHKPSTVKAQLEELARSI